MMQGRKNIKNGGYRSGFAVDPSLLRYDAEGRSVYAWFFLVQGLAAQGNCETFKMERVISFDLKRVLRFPPLAVQQTKFNIRDKLTEIIVTRLLVVIDYRRLNHDG